jgi:hypothetical protein
VNSDSVKAIILLACLVGGSCHVHAQSPKPPLTVREAIQATRVVSNLNGDTVLISPDRKKYLVVLERGDIERNGTWIELLCGGNTSLNVASSPVTITRLFSKSTVGVHDLINNIQWMRNGKSVTFLWNDGSRPAYVASVDLKTRKVRSLVRHSTAIVKYDISANGEGVVFIARGGRDNGKL